jgi:hypothetical protein
LGPEENYATGVITIRIPKMTGKYSAGIHRDSSVVGDLQYLRPTIPIRVVGIFQEPVQDQRPVTGASDKIRFPVPCARACHLNDQYFLAPGKTGGRGNFKITSVGIGC